MIYKPFFCFLLCISIPQTLHAAIVVLDSGAAPLGGRTLNQGWWSDVDTNSPTNDSIQTGSINLGGGIIVNYRSFFTFDLTDPALAGVTIESAQLLVTRGSGTNPNNQNTLSVDLRDVSTTAAELTDTSNTTLRAQIYDDLGTGTTYGQFDVSGAGNASDVIEFDLNAAGINAIQNGIGNGYFSIGASIANSDGDDTLFVESPAASSVSLRLGFSAVPEPSSFAGLSLASLLFIRRRRNN